MKKDISTEEDIKLLVDTFYGKVNQDELLSPVFNDFAKVDWPHHLPTMYKFWGSILLGTNNYSGNPFSKHVRLPVQQQHFQNWIGLFISTVDELFEGPKAEEAKMRARSIAYIFSSKMDAMGLFGK